MTPPLHISRRLMTGAVDHYDLAVSLGANAFWPLDDAVVTTTQGSARELLGGSDSVFDYLTAGNTGISWSQSPIMRSSASSTSTLCSYVAGPTTILRLGAVLPAADMTLNFWWKWHAHVAASSSNAMHSFQFGAGSYRCTTTWKDRFQPADAFHVHSGGYYSYQDTVDVPPGSVLLSGCQYTITQKKTGSDYVGKHYINGELFYTSAASTTPWIGEDTGVYNGFVDFQTKFDSNGPAAWYQSCSYFRKCLTQPEIASLYNAGKL